MGQLSWKETELILVRLALADIDRDRGRAEHLALLVSQSFDQEVEGAFAPEQLEISLKLLGCACVHRLALGRSDGVGCFRRQNLLVGLAHEKFRRKAAGGLLPPRGAAV